MNNNIGESSIDWLLESDNIGVRYLALRDLVKPDAKGMEVAELQAHREGPIGLILDRMSKEGYGVQLGAGYYPTYRGTIWSVILLAQLGGFS